MQRSTAITINATAPLDKRGKEEEEEGKGGGAGVESAAPARVLLAEFLPSNGNALLAAVRAVAVAAAVSFSIPGFRLVRVVSTCAFIAVASNADVVRAAAAGVAAAAAAVKAVVAAVMVLADINVVVVVVVEDVLFSVAVVIGVVVVVEDVVVVAVLVVPVVDFGVDSCWARRVLNSDATTLQAAISALQMAANPVHAHTILSISKIPSTPHEGLSCLVPGKSSSYVS